MGRVVSRQRGYALRAAVAEIISERAMGMQVDQAGDQVEALCVELRRAVQMPDGLNAVGKANIQRFKRILRRVHPRVFNEHAGSPRFLYIVYYFNRSRNSMGVLPVIFLKIRLKCATSA